MIDPTEAHELAWLEAQQDTAYPRPQLRRAKWASLEGAWGFAFDDAGEGLAGTWFAAESASTVFRDTITVPFPPESVASGVGDGGFHPVVWYHRAIRHCDVDRSLERLLLHFGAVDYRAQVWLDGNYLGDHEGGSTPFWFDITETWMSSVTGVVSLVVRAEDDPLDVTQPRGKQDWRPRPHGIWYSRTTGIWQPVWLETVPTLHIQDVAWLPDAEAGTVKLGLRLNGRPSRPAEVNVRLTIRGESLAELTFVQSGPDSATTISLPLYSNGQEQQSLLWSPENPQLIEADIEVRPMCGSADDVSSYFGLRSVGWSDGQFLLNDRPYYVRAVLEQGYWPESHLAAPGADALRAEVQLIKDLGFNTARIHQKIEDPRFLYWADRLGLLVWAESASAYEFSATAIERMIVEWTAVVMRDRSHPSIVTWVPLNESWGVQQISHDPQQLSYARALFHLTKALDPSRPAVSNDGWEHAESDIWTVHDYSSTGAELVANYSDHATVERMLSGFGPLGRRMRLLTSSTSGQPVIVSEFGGVSYAPAASRDSWGYTNVSSADEFTDLLRELFVGLQSSPVLAGFCYTQLTDTLQEANGLADAHRVPKLPPHIVRSIVGGEHVDTTHHRRPKRPVEQLYNASPVDHPL